MAIATVAVRFGLYLVLMIQFGVAAFSLYGLRGAERTSGRVLPSASTILATAVGGAVLSLLSIIVLTASMAGVAITEVDRPTLAMLVGQTSVGVAFQVRVGALLLAGAASLFIRHSRYAGAALGLVVVAAGIAIGTLAWSGHGAATEGALSRIHLAADIIHLLASAGWIGALMALLVLIFRSGRRITEDQLRLSHRALASFASTGTILVAALVATGIGNMLAIVGLTGLVRLPFSLYGQLLVAKLLLFAVMLALAAANRFRLVPRFETAMTAGDHRRALGALRRSLTVEASCAIAILALVAWLGTLDPSGETM